ncbi:hypothetical protein HMPREF1544_08605 [Mucor circinelloides 1006PhL]|uniref:WHIM2 domain-containing protein n=1 Tax=Mucor circinelloides f. circinelloides (strain 1006PhL) TaxID=1220926 RepID=S2J8C6_MUCC1|nr:hypothetical protein HMPREF1544_08605 [Mucor circinelloides 1006PhL]
MSDTTTAANQESVDAPPYQFSSLQQWQIAYIYAFSATFNHHQEVSPQYYKLPLFTPQDLEDEIQKQESELIHQIICACLGNILNRNKPIESFKNSLQQLITDKMKAFDIDFEVNPLLKQNYNALPTDVKLYILYSLIEWQLQDSTAVKAIVDIYNLQDGLTDENPIIARPVGTDSKKRTYWQFGDSPWIWRESSSMKSLSQWETLCRNRQDLEQLVDSFSASTSRLEKALVKTIKEEIYDIAIKEEQRKLRKERAEMRKLIPVEVSITPTTLRSRGNRSQRVHYNFDDIYGIDDDGDNEADDDDNFVDEDDEAADTPTRERSKRQASPPRPPPTRWSSRLNRGAAATATNEVEETPVESMEIDTQSAEAMDTSPLPSEQSNDMDTSRSPSFMDTTPSQSPMEAVSNANGVMNVNDILNPQVVQE